MNAGATAGTSAAVAAAEAERQRQEEEEMTPYDREDLTQDWEFKILRSVTGRFKDQHKMRVILEQEGRAGWVLVEKFDDQRLRLKRRASARDNDSLLEFDPYRTHIGLGQGKFALTILALVLGCVLAIGIFVAFLAQ